MMECAFGLRSYAAWNARSAASRFAALPYCARRRLPIREIRDHKTTERHAAHQRLRRRCPDMAPFKKYVEAFYWTASGLRFSLSRSRLWFREPGKIAAVPLSKPTICLRKEGLKVRGLLCKLSHALASVLHVTSHIVFRFYSGRLKSANMPQVFRTRSMVLRYLGIPVIRRLGIGGFTALICP